MLGLTRLPHNASVMSSTRRTEASFSYISIRDSSTLDHLLRMIANLLLVDLDQVFACRIRFMR